MSQVRPSPPSEDENALDRLSPLPSVTRREALKRIAWDEFDAEASDRISNPRIVVVSPIVVPPRPTRKAPRR